MTLKILNIFLLMCYYIKFYYCYFIIYFYLLYILYILYIITYFLNCAGEKDFLYLYQIIFFIIFKILNNKKK